MPSISLVLNTRISPAQGPTEDLDLLRVVGLRTEDCRLDVVLARQDILQPEQILFWSRGGKVVPVHCDTKVLRFVLKVAG